MLTIERIHVAIYALILTFLIDLAFISSWINLQTIQQFYYEIYDLNVDLIADMFVAPPVVDICYKFNFEIPHLASIFLVFLIFDLSRLVSRTLWYL